MEEKDNIIRTSSLLVHRIDTKDYEPNLRFIEVMKALNTNERIISKLLKTSVSGVSSFTDRLNPKKMTVDFISKLELIIPFLDKDYLMYGEVPMFKRKPTDVEVEIFAKIFGMASSIKQGINRDVCRRVHFVRIKLGDTQLTFADKLNCERHIVASTEGGRQSPTTWFLEALRRNLNVSLDYIIMGEGDMFNRPDIDQTESFRLREKIATLERVINKLSM